jgi:diguanylate cyclase (GGDEF)-like protein
MQDVRYALRQLRKTPGFTITALLTLALGIGANAAIFTLVHSVLLQSLPVADPKSLVRLGDQNDCCVNSGTSDDGNISLFPTESYEKLKASVPEFEELAAMEAGFGFRTITVRRDGMQAEARSVKGEFVSGNYFRTFGLQPHVGRLLTDTDDRKGAPMTAVMSYHAWQRDHAGDTSVIGETFWVNTKPVTVVGIAPEGFYGDRMSSTPPDFYLPIESMPPLANVGFVAGPVLVAVAAAPAGRTVGPRHHVTVGRFGGWTFLLLPYVPLGATGVLVVGRQATGHALTSFELYLGSLVVALVVVRQMITLIDNTALLGHVTNAQQRLRYQAFHDPLTGLANRALFHRCLSTAVELDRGARRLWALLFIDLDDFKAVNDRLGHSVGDQVLQAVGTRLLSCVRETDTVARWGGDEFAVLAETGVDSPDGPAQRILTALRTPFEVNGHVVTIGASIGIAVPDASESSLTAEGLLRQADAAMYAGKRRGKAVLATYRSGAATDHDNPDLSTLLADALADPPEKSGLDVHYQPVVRIADGAHVAVEALARWTHPVIGAIPPTRFVAVAEQTGLVRGLDNFVLDRACRDLATLPADEGLAVHVNVSASRLGNPDLEATVAHTLRRHGLDPLRLVLEITESSRIADPDAAIASARRLARMGVRLALDDFGTGYNSLALLHLLPVDILKLDRNLTELDAYTGNRTRLAVVCRSVLALAADLGITVIAEAIETTGQEAVLAEMGCDYGQGYLYGRPAPLLDTFVRARPSLLPDQRRPLLREHAASSRHPQTPTT